MNTKLALVKSAARLVVGFSTSYVVGSVIKNNIDPEGPVELAEAVIGSVAIGMVVSKATENHVSDFIDRIAQLWSERKTEETAS